MYPVYAFGGKKNEGVVDHCYPLTGKENVPEVCGVDGIIEVYKKALTELNLSG